MQDARHFIERAEHALRTNQPNLATLYMSRAREENQRERQVAALQILGRIVGAEINRIADAIKPAVKNFIDQMAKFVNDMAPILAKAGEHLTESIEASKDSK